MKKCKRCGEYTHTERHHILPACFFRRGKHNPLVVFLCHECHTKVEHYIMAVESFVGGQKFGSRFRLQPNDYIEIARLLNLL